MHGEAWWASALYQPLRATRAAWEEAHPPPRQFLDALELVPVLVDGAEAGGARRAAREPRVVGVPSHAWLAQRVVLAYVLHVPYAEANAPVQMQPFRAAVERVYTWLQRRDDEGWAPRWLGMYSESAVHSAQDTLYHLLGAPQSLAHLGEAVPAALLQLPVCPHKPLEERLGVDRAAYLLQRASHSALSVPDQRFLLALLQRSHDVDPCLGLAAFGIDDVARAAVHNTHAAYAWTLVLGAHAFPWEALGEALSLHACAGRGPQRRVHDFLAQLLQSTYSYTVQTQCMPGYLGLRAQQLAPPAADDEASTEEFAVYVAQLIEKGLLPIHASQRTWDVAQNTDTAHDTLDALAVELRSLALAYSKYAFGAQLFSALTSLARA